MVRAFNPVLLNGQKIVIFGDKSTKLFQTMTYVDVDECVCVCVCVREREREREREKRIEGGRQL